MDKKQKILIVDDAKFNRDILKEILGDTYNYLEAENGNQAIQMIGENIGNDAEATGKNNGCLSSDGDRYCYNHNRFFAS